MWVVKASGETEKFDPKKIKRTCLRAGVSEELANKIVREVRKKSYNGISTKEILHLTLNLLNKKKPHIAARYDLKGAMFRLGPAGFVFEHFIGEIFKEYGYTTNVHNVLKGFCVSHEVDVIATKKNQNYMIECKYHNLPGIYTGLREVLYTYARFLDLLDGAKQKLCKKFEQAWLVCNTKFSEDSIRYAKCKGIKLVGWNYPEDNSLKMLIEKKKLYPITMIKGLDSDSLEKMSSSDFVLALDLLRVSLKELNKITKVPIKKLGKFAEEARKVCYG
ncbi:MAG: ATPase [Candidatus Aenigmarchaeota archaeon]|nr:ATPase [Candidatus Aenigmarchaeota archaeon]